MATSGVTTWSLTAAQLVEEALSENAILQVGRQPKPAEIAKCILRMNGMFKTWQMQGLGWKQETITQVITGGEAAVVLPSYVREVNGARFVESANYERIMQRFERDEYYRLPNKASAGRSTAYYIDRNPAAITLYVWPVPADDSDLKLDIDRKLDTVTTAGEAIDFPEELQETVYANLAVRCAGIFGQQPSEELYTRAMRLEREMLDAYRPASYHLEAF